MLNEDNGYNGLTEGGLYNFQSRGNSLSFRT